MHDGFYVGRRPKKSRSNKYVIVETRAFTARSDSDDDQWRMRRDVTSWAEFIQTEHPGDDVFIFKVCSIEDMKKTLDD